MTSPTNRTKRASDDLGVFDPAETYYASDERHAHKAGARTRTYSQNSLAKQLERIGLKEPYRRGSHDEAVSQGRRFLIDVESTLKSLQEQEDTDRNMQITIEDEGPKVRDPDVHERERVTDTTSGLVPSDGGVWRP